MTQRSLVPGMPVLRTATSSLVFALSVFVTQVSVAQSTAPTRQDDATKSTSPDASTDDLLHAGIVAYKKRDYEVARNALLAAFQKDQAPSIITLLADVEMKLKRFRDAAEHWAIYLNGLSSEQSSERSEALLQIEICRKYVGVVNVTTDPKDADVIVDGVNFDVARTAGELWLEPGTHLIKATVEASVSDPISVVVKPGDRTIASLTVPVPAPIPVATKAPPVVALATIQPQESKSIEPKTLVAIGGGLLTLVGLTVSTVFWFKNDAAADDNAAARALADKQSGNSALIADHAVCAVANPPPACKRMRETANEVSRTADISDYSLIATGVVALATVGTYLLWPKSKDTPSAVDRKTSLVVTPWWSPSSQGATVRVEF
jgi:hypothetical protein